MPTTFDEEVADEVPGRDCAGDDDLPWTTPLLASLDRAGANDGLREPSLEAGGAANAGKAGAAALAEAYGGCSKMYSATAPTGSDRSNPIIPNASTSSESRRASLWTT